MNMFDLFRKPVKREIHEFPIAEKDLNKDTWAALFSIGVPVTFKQDLRENATATGKKKEFIYYVSILVARDQWDRLNRRLGKLGIDEIEDEEFEEVDD